MHAAEDKSETSMSKGLAGRTCSCHVGLRKRVEHMCKRLQHAASLHTCAAAGLPVHRTAKPEFLTVEGFSSSLSALYPAIQYGVLQVDLSALLSARTAHTAQLLLASCAGQGIELTGENC